MKALIAVAVAVTLVVIVGISNYVSYANYGNRAEVQIDKEYENLQNVLSQYSLKVAEIAQVPAMMKDDMKEVMVEVMVARQGPDGSKALFQWFQEHQINLSPELYTKIQRTIEAGRNQFQNAQTRFIDIKSVYVTNLGYVWSGFWLKLAGYPTINVGYPRGTADDYPIVKAARAVKAFETGVDTAIKLR